MSEDARTSSSTTVAGTVALRADGPGGAAQSSLDDSSPALTLLWAPEAWRLEIRTRDETETIVAETLGELRLIVEERLGEGAWRALLQASASALRDIAPGIVEVPSAAARAIAR